MSFPPLAAAALALALAACASPTPYQPAWVGDGYGYSEQRIEENRVRISFAGNSATSPETAWNYVLHRAAELTLARGGDHFIVASRSRTPDYAAGPSTRVGTGVGVGSGGRMRTGWSLGLGLPVAQSAGPAEASAEIVIRRGPKPEGAADAFDAREVTKNLGPQILRPGE